MKDERIELMQAWERLAAAQVAKAEAGGPDMLETRNAAEIAGLATSKALALARHIHEEPTPIPVLAKQWAALDEVMGRA